MSDKTIRLVDEREQTYLDRDGELYHYWLLRLDCPWPMDWTPDRLGEELATVFGGLWELAPMSSAKWFLRAIHSDREHTYWTASRLFQRGLYEVTLYLKAPADVRAVNRAISAAERPARRP